ncbi:tetratricopeptide repeat protein [Chryseobacterium sp. 2TAF14]|uniref:tetratricopeptide repeat protein n=1 Tax=Chryseobacterium sp. 2TAF14 TaxID=3233007 RepID=UPI003F8FFB83
MKNFLIFICIISLLQHCKKDTKEDEVLTSNPNFEKAKKFKNISVDSAFAYFNIAKNDFLNKNDSVGAARSLINMAIIQSDTGDFYGSIETSLEADKYLKTAVKTEFVNNLYSSNYNNLAISSKSLKNYSDAEKYYQNALETTDKPEYKSVINNNIGDVLILQNKTDPAINLLEGLLKTRDSISYARVLNNLAKAKFLKNTNYNAVPELQEALQIRKTQKDSLGINSSFATLADFFKSKDKTQSLFYAKLMLERAEKNESPDDQLEALQKIIELDEKNYLKYFNQFQKLNDSTQTARNKAKNQFAIVRYDVEQKNAENQNLKLKDVENEINIIYLSFGLGISALTLIIGFFWNEKRKKNIRREKEHEKQIEVKNTELKYSKKVHDVVANGIYQVMTKIENQNDFNKEQALDELEFVYEKSRDISYENPDSQDEKFHEKISKLVASFKNDEVKTFTVGNQEENWENVTASTQTEIYQIIRELLVNMKKHSKASNVIFKFEKINNLIYINYADNGIGIADELIFKNGLSNTVSRIENINGKITFETKTEKGLKINISFPVS